MTGPYPLTRQVPFKIAGTAIPIQPAATIRMFFISDSSCHLPYAIQAPGIFRNRFHHRRFRDIFDLRNRLDGNRQVGRFVARRRSQYSTGLSVSTSRLARGSRLTSFCFCRERMTEGGIEKNIPLRPPAARYRPFRQRHASGPGWRCFPAAGVSHVGRLTVNGCSRADPVLWTIEQTVLKFLSAPLFGNLP